MLKGLAVLVFMVYMAFMIYAQRNAIEWLNHQMAENAKVEVLWKEAIKRCLAD